MKIIDDPAINAFALPGGVLYVNSGLLLAADEEDQLAGMMAHEIAHVAARLCASQATLVQYATLPLIFTLTSQRSESVSGSSPHAGPYPQVAGGNQENSPHARSISRINLRI